MQQQQQQQQHHHHQEQQQQQQQVVQNNPRQRQKAKRVLWSDADSMHLCLSWIGISQDSIIGDNQRDNSFWQRIAKAFHKGSSEIRTMQAIKTKYGEINRDTQKFCGCYRFIKNQNESGKTEEDQIRDALDLYRERYKKHFAFLSCWEVLKQVPKWSSGINTPHPMTNDPASTTGKIFLLLFYFHQYSY